MAQEIDAEFEAKLEAMKNDIAELVGRVPEWEADVNQGIPIGKLVRGLRSFKGALEAQERLEAQVGSHMHIVWACALAFLDTSEGAHFFSSHSH